MKLFVIYIGGRAPGSLVEVHDMRIIPATTLSETYPLLRKTWWGLPESLHIDCWGTLEYADSHQITLCPKPFLGEEKLYFINLGGYDPQNFTELHANLFLVAPRESLAKKRALQEHVNWYMPHKDNLYEVENIVCVNDLLKAQNLHIHLAPTATSQPFRFQCGYQPLPKKRECQRNE